MDYLEDQGFETRTRDPEDRRRQLVALTPREGMLAEANDYLMAPLSPAERIRFVDFLHRMRESLVQRLADEDRE